MSAFITTGFAVVMKCDHAVSLRLNDVANPQFGVSLVPGGEHGYFLVTGNITKLFVSTGTEQTTVVVGFAGDSY